MGGIDGQNLAIRCLSLLQPSGLVVNETRSHQVFVAVTGEAAVPAIGGARWQLACRTA
jgi:hypothetical protein